MTEITKVCNVCGRELPASCFYVRRASKDALDYRCKDCAKEYAQWYRDTYPEKVKEISAKTRAKNRERIRQRQNEKYAINKKNPEYMRKRLEYAREHYPERREKNRMATIEFNNQKGNCEKCGESRKYLIQYHHIDPKTKLFSIGESVNSKRKEVLDSETKKCVCLCSNCHDEFHYFYGSRPEDPVGSLCEYLGRELKDSEKEAIEEYYKQRKGEAND